MNRKDKKTKKGIVISKLFPYLFKPVCEMIFDRFY